MGSAGRSQFDDNLVGPASGHRRGRDAVLLWPAAAKPRARGGAGGCPWNSVCRRDTGRGSRGGQRSSAREASVIFASRLVLGRGGLRPPVGWKPRQVSASFGKAPGRHINR